MNAHRGETLTVGGLFDGCGLLAYGLHLAGLEHRWLCEVDEFRQGILRQRFPGIHVYPDVRAVDFRSSRVDVIAGGFPCKGASSAGKREGFGHPETALWKEMFRAIRDLEPRFVLVENVADLLSIHGGAVFGEVLSDLASLGYDAEWDCFPASAFGATHRRDRVFVTATAHTDVPGEQRHPGLRGKENGRLDARGDVEAPAYPDQRGSQAVQKLPRRRDEVQREAPRRDDLDRRADPATDAAGERRAPLPDQVAVGGAIAGTRTDRGRPVAWGDYEGTIETWEILLGRRAPEPLVCGVDDGRTRRVERSRLSALGDGVLVQAGWLCGRRIMMHAHEHGFTTGDCGAVASEKTPRSGVAGLVEGAP